MVDDVREDIESLLDSEGEGEVVAADVFRHLVTNSTTFFVFISLDELVNEFLCKSITLKSIPWRDMNLGSPELKIICDDR